MEDGAVQTGICPLPDYCCFAHSANAGGGGVLLIAYQGLYYPFLGKDELEKRLPSLIKKRYLTYSSFAGQPVDKILEEKMNTADKFNAAMLSSVLLINNGNGKFILPKLPYPLQWSPMFSFIAGDFNNDNKTDILAAGNFYGVVPYEGRYDAIFPGLLLQQDTMNFLPAGLPVSGLEIPGEVRDIKMIRLCGKQKAFLIARNNGRIAVVKKRQGTR